jgi:hypothetical protein
VSVSSAIFDFFMDIIDFQLCLMEGQHPLLRTDIAGAPKGAVIVDSKNSKVCCRVLVMDLLLVNL